MPEMNIPQRLRFTICWLALLALPYGLAADESTEPKPVAPGYQPLLELELAGHKAALILPEDASAFPGPIPLVVFSGGAGSGGYRPQNAIILAQAFSEMPLQPAILTSRYRHHISPGADGGVGLLEAVDAAAEQFGTSRGFFLTGSSRGAQFTHRFVFHAAPQRVFAAATCNAGGYSLPQGGTLGRQASHKVGDPRPDNRRDWSHEDWAAHLQPALPEARTVPFLVLCTTGDTSRLPIAIEFAQHLKEQGWEHLETSFDIPGGHSFRAGPAERVAQFFTEMIIRAMNEDDDEEGEEEDE